MLNLLLTAALALIAAPRAQDTPVQMKTYQLAILRTGTVKAPEGAAAQQAMQQHLDGLADLNRRRINLLYGPMVDGGAIQGICVLDVPTADDARKALANDPHIKSGSMVLEIKPWLGPQDFFHTPASYDVMKPENLEPLVFGILVRGANRSQNDKEAEDIQKAHLAYMDSLHQQGKLLVAGPFTDDTDWRGIVIYRVKTIADAQALAAGDPAVKAGRLTLEAHPWMTLRGILK
jgi:uncharacterized protein YciI